MRGWQKGGEGEATTRNLMRLYSLSLQFYLILPKGSDGMRKLKEKIVGAVKDILD